MNVLKEHCAKKNIDIFICGHNNCCLQLSKNDIASGLSVINFSDEKLIFGKDLVKSIDDIFRKFKYRKLEFSAVVGNLIIDNYDKLCLKYGGKIVSVRKEHYVIEAKYYDEKMCEIMREEYLKVC